jgi:hypothetical protein
VLLPVERHVSSCTTQPVQLPAMPPLVLPPARCFCSSLQSGRCTFQCAFWQAGLQYRTASQPPHSMPAPSTAHLPHGLWLKAAGVAADDALGPAVLAMLLLVVALLRLLPVAQPARLSLGMCGRPPGRPVAAVVLPEPPSALVLVRLWAARSLAVLLVRIGLLLALPLGTAALLLLLVLVLQGMVALPETAVLLQSYLGAVEGGLHV